MDFSPVRCRVRVHLLDDRLVDVVGKVPADRGDLLTDVLDGQVYVALELELHDHVGETFRAG
jgi:hypothetical protein